MELWVATISIAVALTLGAMSPGPSFLMVARTALATSRREALAAAIGMGAGGVLFSAIALFGLLALLASAPSVYVAAKTVGGVYLIYLGQQIWRGAKQPLVVAEESTRPWSNGSVRRFFLLGFTTQISNPKTVVVYASVFSLLPGQVPTVYALFLPFLIFVIEAGWYAIVAVTLSAPQPRARYLDAKSIIDRTAGALIVILGARLLFAHDD